MTPRVGVLVTMRLLHALIDKEGHNPDDLAIAGDFDGQPGGCAV
jgi:hypothetical protein